MIASDRLRKRVFPALAILAPVLGVQAFRTFSGWQVPVSSASVANPEAPAVPLPATPKLKPEAQKAADWIVSHRGQNPTKSPMDHPPASLATEPRSKQPTPTEPVTPPPVPVARRPVGKLMLSAVISGEGGVIASINGKLYRVGDEIEQDWKITAIEPRRMVVVMSGPDGNSVELSRNGIEEK